MRAQQPISLSPSSESQTIPNSLSSLEALADHDLVALLEDVERHQLLREQHEAEGEEREAQARLHPSHPSDASAASAGGLLQPTPSDWDQPQTLPRVGRASRQGLWRRRRACARRSAASARAADGPYGPLGPPDALGLMLPPGFRAREIARCLRPMAGTEYGLPDLPGRAGRVRHSATAAGSSSPTPSRSRPRAPGRRRSASTATGRIVDAYRMLGGTNANCAGGPTPWGTWLSCEEYHGGHGLGVRPGRRAGGRGRARRWGCSVHEAAAVDPGGRQALHDRGRARRRLLPLHARGYPNLDAGLLEVAVVGGDGQVSWRALPNPTPTPADDAHPRAGGRR